MEIMVWVWLVLLAAFITIESATLALVSIWFIGGTAVALVFALCHLPIWAQCVAFVVVSTVLLTCLRPFMKKYINSKKVSTNVNALIGERAVVTEAIDNLRSQGTVKVGGNAWTARSIDDKAIPPETVVVIRKIEGVKVFVEPETKP